MNHHLTFLRSLALLGLLTTGGLTARAQNIGVGTLTPSQKLDVVGGNIKISTAGSTLIFPDGTTQNTAATSANLTGDVTSTGAATTYGNVVPATKGGAGTVSGLLKANGSGVVSPATAGTDYLTPTGANAAYIQNAPASQQTGSFNLSGAGTLGGNSTVGGSHTVAGAVQAGTNLVVDAAGANAGTTTSILRFGATGTTSGEGIGSRRTAGGNQYGLDFYTISTARLSITGSGNVGIGTTNPGQALEVNGNVLIPSVNDYLLRDANHGLGWYGTGKLWNGLNIDGPAVYGYSGGVLGTNRGGTRTTALTWNNAGQVGIGTAAPRGQFDVAGTGDTYLTSNPANSGTQSLFLSGHIFVAPYGGGAYSYIQARGVANQGFIFRTNNGGNYVEALTLNPAGYVGVGTTTPSFPFDVQTTATTGAYSFGYLNPSGSTGSGSIGTNGVGISIRATGRILSSEFNAVSDRRLKTVVGLSDRTADLALLNKLRITNYTMRDKVQFGNRAFKKVIAQEVEAVFPQAVQQQTGFLPDVYALATAVQLLPGDSLVALTLPAAGLPTAATAGQRLKLVGETGEVQAALVRPAAAGARVLVLRRATALAGTKVFVFGLEHPDVRSVDYEALSMLNVSATQELARKVEALEKQNAALQTGSAADHASLLTLQAQMARLLGETVLTGTQAHK